MDIVSSYPFVRKHGMKALVCVGVQSGELPTVIYECATSGNPASRQTVSVEIGFGSLLVAASH